MRLTKNITPASIARINAQLAKLPRTLSNTGENWYTVIHFMPETLTGVIDWYSVDHWCLDEMIENGDDLNWIEYERECKATLDDDELESAFMFYESDSVYVLVGHKYNPETDQYDIDPGAEFSAIISNGNGCPTIQVVRSKHIGHYRSLCSPCYPNQVDCDSGAGNLPAYTLPPEYFKSDDEF